MQATLLEALTKFDEGQVLEMLKSGELELTGNFKGHEKEVAADWEKVEAA